MWLLGFSGIDLFLATRDGAGEGTFEPGLRLLQRCQNFVLASPHRLRRWSSSFLSRVKNRGRSVAPSSVFGAGEGTFEPGLQLLQRYRNFVLASPHRLRRWSSRLQSHIKK